MIAHSPNVRVYSSVVFRNGDGIGLKQSDRGSGPYGPYVVKNAYVHDNIITTCEGGTGAARTGDVDSSIYDPMIASTDSRTTHIASTLDPRSAGHEETRS
jgi:hypothetical protein